MDWTELLAALSDSRSPLAIGVAVLMGSIGGAALVTAIAAPVYWFNCYYARLRAEADRETLEAEMVAKGFQKEFVASTGYVWRKVPPR